MFCHCGHSFFFFKSGYLIFLCTLFCLPRSCMKRLDLWLSLCWMFQDGLGRYRNQFTMVVSLPLCRACQQIQRSADGDEDPAHQKQVTQHHPSSLATGLLLQAAAIKTISVCCLSLSCASKTAVDSCNSPELPQPQEGPYGNTQRARRTQTRAVSGGLVFTPSLDL